MARPITPEQVEVLRREFQKLQDQLDSLEFPKDASEGLEQFNKTLKESYLAIDEQAKILRGLNKQREEQLRVLSELDDRSQAYTNQLARITETDRALTDSRDNLSNSHTRLSATLADNIDQLGKAGEAAQLYTEALKALKKSQDASMSALERAAAYDEYITKLRTAGAELEEFTDDVKFGEDTFDSLSQSILGLSGPFKTFVDLLSKGEGGLQGIGQKALAGVKSGELLQNAMLQLVKVSFDFAMEQDKIFSEFRKATGAGKEFNQVIKDVEGSGRIAGVTLAEAAEAVGALKNTFTDFTYYGPEVQKEIAKTTTILAEMGFSAQTQAQIWQTATQSMGMSIEGAQNLMLDLASTARSLGVDIDTLGSQFEANKDILTIYGARAGEVFKEMAVQSKALGVDVGTMLGLMEGFQTFDSAATSVGRLNAILGGPFLNAIDMLNASYEDPVEGIKMLRDAMDEAGVSAEDLSGAELKAMSDALGLSTTETAAMLGKSNEELAIQQMSMAQAAEEAKNMQAITDKLANAFKQLYLDAEPFVTNVLVPMIDKFATFMGWIGEAIRNMKTLGSTAIFAGMAIAGLMMATGIGTPFGIAAMAVLGGLAVGTATAAAEGGAEEGAPNLTGFASGGRVLRSHRLRRIRSFADGGVASSVGMAAIGGFTESNRIQHAMMGRHESEGAVAGSPSVPIRMNEANRKEMAVVPSGTMVANADDTKNVIKSNEAMIAEIRGLRKDMATASRNTNKKVQLVLDNGREFSTTVVREGLSGDIVTPFGI